MNRFARELRTAFAGRLVFSCVLLVVAAVAFAQSPVTSRATGDGDWLIVGSAGARRVALLDCRSGRVLADADVPAGLAAAPLIAPPHAHVLTRRSELLSFELPSLRPLRERELPMVAHTLVASPAGLLAVGGRGPIPLVVVDASTLADVHVYRPEPATAIGALEHVPGRASFLAGLAEPASPAEVWELAYGTDAPPVFRGLVHDYRMGEAVALPGRFTPRPSPVSSPTAALVAGPTPYEWLRIDAAGDASVLHLEVRREIARLPRGGWLAAASRDEGSRGWLVGRPGGRTIERLESGSWRLADWIDLPGALVAIHEIGGARSAVVAVGNANEVELLQVEGRSVRPAGVRTSDARAPLRLSASRDGRCVALLDATDRWLGAARTP